MPIGDALGQDIEAAFLEYGDDTFTFNQTVTTCEELGGVTAAFDTSDGTITIPVPASTLAPDGVAACDAISAGAPLFEGGPIFAAPSAFFTSTAMPHDTAMHWVPPVVPHDDPALSCDA